MTKELFSKMVERAKTVIRDDFKLELNNVHIVSGGAAWAGEYTVPCHCQSNDIPYLCVCVDHVAVVLYLHDEVSQLTLHLPASWDKSQYTESKVTSPTGWISAGKSSNKLHKQFSGKIGEDSLSHIESAMTLGATHHIHEGFQRRNTEVAKSPYLVAFTWSDGTEPKKGGSVDTWKKCHSRTKRHISLNTLCVSRQDNGKRKRNFDNDAEDVECDGPKRLKQSKKAVANCEQTLLS